MHKQIALYGGNFNPPTHEQRAVVRELIKQDYHVIVVPCGPRSDKPRHNDVLTADRAVMADLNFQGLANVTVYLDDLEQDTFTPIADVLRKLGHWGSASVVIGSDLLVGLGSGTSKVQRYWKEANDLLTEHEIIVLDRENDPLSPDDHPLKHTMVSGWSSLTSADVRAMIFQGHNARQYLYGRVAEYIEHRKLYRGCTPPVITDLTVSEPLRAMFVVDERNPRALDFYERLKHLEHKPGQAPNLIITIGGDGMVQRTVGTHWRLRLPIFGINAGHRGYLLNEPDRVFDEVTGLLSSNRRLSCYHLPLLYAEAEMESGKVVSMVGMNDAWIKAPGGQGLNIDAYFGDHLRFPALSCDQLLVSTAAGCTGYAYNLGATLPPIESQDLILVGAGADRRRWTGPYSRSASTIFRFVTADETNGQKRPVDAYCCSKQMNANGDSVRQFIARMSRIAVCELVFLANSADDLAAKRSLY